METNVTNKGRPAVLVDWDSFRSASDTHGHIINLHDNASIVLLVADPEKNDYSYEYPELFDVVIRNHGLTSNMAFKTSALCVVQDSTTLVPVVAFDSDFDVLAMFEDGGVLVTYVS